MVLVRCDNCDWEGEDDAPGFTPLEKCCDLTARLEAGSEVPAGDCPECRCFCYLADKARVVNKDGVLVDLEYIQKQLELASRWADSVSCKDAIGRAQDALERLLEKVK